MNNLKELQNPLIKDLVSRLRNQNQTPHSFQEIIANLTLFLLYEALNGEKMYPKEITTWQGENSFDFLQQANLVFIPILRAGMPMLNSVSKLLPESVSGFLAMKRDEQSLRANLLYDRIPDVKDKTVFLLDPMVATGGSLSDAIKFIQLKKPQKIVCLNLIGYDESIKKLAKTHSDIKFYIAQIDPILNEDGFIVPGIGDAGDRAYNTL